MEITSWLVSAYDFYSRATSEPIMKLFVYSISTEYLSNKLQKRLDDELRLCLQIHRLKFLDDEMCFIPS